MLKWISEADELPPIAQQVLLMHPRQTGEFWDFCVAQLLVQHEDVAPRPVPKGSPWPSTYYWAVGRSPREGSSYLVTGNSWWASFKDLPLPPGAEHRTDREFNYIAQPESVWIDQAKRTAP